MLLKSLLTELSACGFSKFLMLGRLANAFADEVLWSTSINVTLGRPSDGFAGKALGYPFKLTTSGGLY
jgi:hypothetical protein